MIRRIFSIFALLVVIGAIGQVHNLPLQGVCDLEAGVVGRRQVAPLQEMCNSESQWSDGDKPRPYSMKQLFINMPDTIMPLLTKVNREDFGDFLDSGMAAVVKNRFGETAEMTTLTKDYLFIKETSASTVQMKVLPMNDSISVICEVRTFNAPLPDSRIRFYSTKWERLDEKDFLDDDFFGLKYKGLVELSLSDTSDSLKAVTTSFQGFRDEVDSSGVNDHTNQEVVTQSEERGFTWVSGKYVMEHVSGK